MPTTPNTSDDDGLAAAAGAAGIVPGGGIPGIEGIVGGADAKMPPCSGHICVGWVPVRNGNSTCLGHAELASPPDSGSTVAIVIPDGSGKSSGSAGAASCIK